MVVVVVVVVSGEAGFRRVSEIDAQWRWERLRCRGALGGWMQAARKQ